jgi:hypothetical protein
VIAFEARWLYGCSMAGYKPVRASAILLCAGIIFLLAGRQLRADRVEMQNGDLYTGKVLELNSNSVVLQNDVLGKVSVPRGRIAAISFGNDPGTNTIPLSGATNNPARSWPKPARPLPAPGTPDLRQINTNSTLVQEIEDQFLKEASPEAKAKFHEMLGGLSDGKLDINDVRNQARQAVDQIRSIQKDAGGEAGGMLDAYAAILERFLKETDSPSTNIVASPPRLNLAPRDGQ